MSSIQFLLNCCLLTVNSGGNTMGNEVTFPNSPFIQTDNLSSTCYKKTKKSPGIGLDSAKELADDIMDTRVL